VVGHRLILWVPKHFVRSVPEILSGGWLICRPYHVQKLDHPCFHLLGGEVALLASQIVIARHADDLPLQIATPNKVARWEPLVAKFDLETGTTSWDGGNEGIWIATLPDNDGQPASEPFSSSGPWGEFVSVDHTETASAEIPHGMLRSVKLTFRRVAESPVRVDFGFMSSNWEATTWLPASPGTPDVAYVPAPLP
jgi:hypothetical protein